MATKEAQDKKPETRRASSTSPPDGRIDKATKPPATGQVNQEAVERGWAALDLAAGGH
jgi:hypothetical protein